MKVTANDFSGYNEHCSVIKGIKEWASDREFTVDELMAFSHHATIQEIVKYLNVDRHQEFFEAYLKADTLADVENIKLISERLSERLSACNAEIDFYKGQTERLSLFETKSEIYQKISRIDTFESRSKVYNIVHSAYNGEYLDSYRKTNSVLKDLLRALIWSVEFKEGDFEKMFKQLGAGYWLDKESVYENIITSRNNSALNDFEKYFKRQPYILKNKRLYEGFKFYADSIRYRCTGWTENENIKLVTDNTEKQNRYSFDKKQFKEFFKDKNIENWDYGNIHIRKNKRVTSR